MRELAGEDSGQIAPSGGRAQVMDPADRGATNHGRLGKKSRRRASAWAEAPAGFADLASELG